MGAPKTRKYTKRPRVKKNTSIPPSKRVAKAPRTRETSVTTKGIGPIARGQPGFESYEKHLKDTNPPEKKKTLGEKLKPVLDGAKKLGETNVFGDLAEMSKGVSTGSGGPIGKGADPAATSPLVYHDPDYEDKKKRFGII